AHLPLVQEDPLSAAYVLRILLPPDRRMDVHPGHRDNRDLLDLLPRHGRETDPRSDPRRRREHRWGLPEDGDDALLRRHDEGADPDRDARQGRLEALGGTPRQRPRHPSLRAAEGGCEMTFLDRTTDARRFRQWEGNMEADYIRSEERRVENEQQTRRRPVS